MNRSSLQTWSCFWHKIRDEAKKCDTVVWTSAGFGVKTFKIFLIYMFYALISHCYITHGTIQKLQKNGDVRDQLCESQPSYWHSWTHAVVLCCVLLMKSSNLSSLTMFTNRFTTCCMHLKNVCTYMFSDLWTLSCHLVCIPYPGSKSVAYWLLFPMNTTQR